MAKTQHVPARPQPLLPVPEIEIMRAFLQRKLLVRKRPSIIAKESSLKERQDATKKKKSASPTGNRALFHPRWDMANDVGLKPPSSSVCPF